MTLPLHIRVHGLILTTILFLTGCPSRPAIGPPAAPKPTAPKPTATNEELPKETQNAADGPDFVVIFEKMVEIDPTETTTIVLEDGVEIEIPRGSLDSRSLKVQKHRFDPVNAEPYENFDYYQLNADTSGLKSNVTLRFPLELDEVVKPDAVRVLHHHDSGETEELSGTYDAINKTFSVQISSFSDVSQPIIPGDLFAIAERLAAVNPQKVHLRPKYYSQFDHGWCWAAAFAMMISSHGQPLHPEQVAELYGVRKSDGFAIMPILGYSTDPVAMHPAARNLKLVPYRFGGITEKRLRGFIIKQLDQGYPIWLGLPQYAPGADHVILVIGYSHDGLFIHDPSGALFAHLEKITEADDQRETEYANYFISFDKWAKIVNPWRAQAVVVENKIPDDSEKCSIQIPLGSQGMTFQRTGLRFVELRSVFYYWNGNQPSGGGFSVAEKDENKRALQGISNSDYLTELNVLLHNTGENGVTGSIDVQLDGKVLLKDFAVSIPANKTNNRFELFNQSRMVRPASPHQPYTTLFDRNDLLRGLDFNQHPLALGEHKLEFILWNESHSKVIDRSVVVYDQLPALAAQATVYKKVDSSRTSVKHVIQFEHSPEATRLGYDQVAYEIWRKVSAGKSATEPHLVATLEGPFDGPVEYELEAPPAELRSNVKSQYHIVTVDKKTRLRSPFNQPSDSIDSIPETGPIKYLLTDIKYNASIRNGRKVEETVGDLDLRRPILKLDQTPPYEMELEITVPSSLNFTQLATLEVDNAGQPLTRAKQNACGLQSNASFLLKRTTKINEFNAKELPKDFNSRIPPKPICRLNVESTIDLFTFRTFNGVQVTDVKTPVEPARYTIVATVKNQAMSADDIRAIMVKNSLPESLSPEEDLLTTTSIRHTGDSEQKLEHIFEHKAIVAKGALAPYGPYVSLFDVKMNEKVKAPGGCIIVKMTGYLKYDLFSIYHVDVYLVYRHQP